MGPRRLIATVTLTLSVVGGTACSTTSGTPSTSDLPVATSTGPATRVSGSATSTGQRQPAVTVLADHLDVPWDVTFLPDGNALMTLRDKAHVLRVSPTGATTDLGRVPGVVPDGEGGLLGIAPSPAYATNHTVFLYFTAATDNRIARATVDGNRITGVTPILTGIDKAGFHNGGRIAFGPDGFLYAGVGDAGEGDIAQNKSSLNGKILRITTDGRAAPGNPFGNRTWTYGHRNVQGLAWAPDGTMYASEFGQNTWDELNRIVKGRNYGWPRVEGRAGNPAYADPLVQWHTDDASPSGIAYAGGSVYMAALKGESLWRVPVQPSVGTPQRLFHNTYGRLRDAAVAPDGRLWVLTSNTFRGTPGPDDDRLLAVTIS
jgi:glucose/arabinose dehydrogenase